MDSIDTKQLSELIEAGDSSEAVAFIESLSPSDTVWHISRLNDADRKSLMTLLSPPEAADLLLDLPEEQAADLLEETDAHQAAEIVEELPPQDQADILAEVEEEEAQAILDEMQVQDGDLVRELLEYPEDSAGGLMDTRFLAYSEMMSVGEVLQDLREHVDTYSDYDVQYVYVTTSENQLLGVLRLRDLVMTSTRRTISKIMLHDPVFIQDDTTLDTLRDFFVEHASFLGVPVTKRDGTLVGVVRRDDVHEAESNQAKSTFLKISGIIGGEEFRSMPLLRRSFRRLSWLGPNILLNIIAASVIALFQDTLQAVIALAVFLPIISDMSGCSGNQAVAVSIRELSLGLIRPTEMLRVLIKEAGLGLINGIALGLLLGAAAFLWQGNIYLGLVVGVALALNTLLSVLLGGLVPLLLNKMKIDPALASGPLLTTVTDMCGFFLVLSLANVMLLSIAG